MSRAMNVSMPQAGVLASCTKAGVSVSAVEELPSGGTHLVCTTGEGAEEMRGRLKAHLIQGRVKRFAFASVRFTA